MSASALRRGRHAAPRRRRWIWLVTLALVAVLFSTLVATSGTYALWNKAASTSASTVTSGTAALSIGGLSSMNTGSMGPGGATTGTFTVTNTGSVPLSMRVTTGSTSVASANGASNSTVLGALTIRLSLVASAGACTAGLSGASGAIASFDTGAGYYTLPAGASGIGCVEVDLASSAPQSVSGATTSFSLTATGTQVAS
jgi:hypothetical protein